MFNLHHKDAIFLFIYTIGAYYQEIIRFTKINRLSINEYEQDVSILSYLKI